MIFIQIIHNLNSLHIRVYRFFGVLLLIFTTGMDVFM